MKITRLKTFLFNVETGEPPARDPATAELLSSEFKTWLLLKVETDVGLCGWGEGSGEWLSPIVATTLRDWAPAAAAGPRSDGPAQAWYPAAGADGATRATRLAHAATTPTTPTTSRCSPTGR